MKFPQVALALGLSTALLAPLAAAGTSPKNVGNCLGYAAGQVIGQNLAAHVFSPLAYVARIPGERQQARVKRFCS